MKKKFLTYPLPDIVTFSFGLMLGTDTMIIFLPIMGFSFCLESTVESS